MKRNIHLYNRLLNQFKRYQRKLQRIQDGRSKYSRKELLIKRIQRIYAQLRALKKNIQISMAAAAMTTGFMLSAPISGQSQTLSLKTDNPLGLVSLENRAKPALVDWDGDGDMDLFVGGKIDNVVDSLSNGILYYQNEGGLLRQAQSPFPTDLQIPAALVDTAFLSPSFVDLDGDEDMDSFVGTVEGNLLYFRNDDGTLVRVDGMENPFDGIQIGGSTHASPTFVDVDGDGDMDAVIGKNDGLLSYYNNDGGVFTEVSSGSPFENINVTEKAAPSFADWDGDGDMDLIVGNKDGILDYYVNEGGVYTAATPESNPFGHITIELNTAPAIGDMDDDGDLDLIVGNDKGLVRYFRNDPDTLMHIPTNTIGLTNEEGFENLNYTFIDADGDGDMDAYAGEIIGSILYFENTDGMMQKVNAHPLDIIPANDQSVTSWVPAPSFADIDADGDMDAFIGTYQDNIKYYANSDGVFAQDTMGNPFSGIDPGDTENIAFIDWDGDGDMDAFIGNKAGEVKYYQNDESVFTAAVGPLDGVSFAGERLPNWSAKPAFADVDGDGDMDAYVGTLDGSIRVFDNEGGILTEKTGADNPFNGMDFGRSAAPDFGDIDGDGDMDLLVANAKGLTFHLENTGSVANKIVRYDVATILYPNPTSGMVRLEVPWLKQSGVVSVTNMAGQILNQQVIRNPVVDLDLGNFSTGVYLVHIHSDSGQAVKKVFIK